MKSAKDVRRLTAVTGCLVAAGVTLLAGASVGPAAAQPRPVKTPAATDLVIPAELAVPAGNERVAVLDAQGVQTYTCTDGAWTLLEPAATLWKKSDSRRRAIALHSRGPVWVSTVDGSAVNAAAVANAPKAETIPQLLLKANAHRGTGVFAEVSYIQRLDTKGGVAPAGSCASDATEQVSVPYSATYVFYEATAAAS
ncbi:MULTISPECIES: DUF3455 domain-containing protein [unclassified Streptomyces]|uniref:DUF3455 domain-containing protein n=1 Tax=unclassified Streptomyces TaxID=2593676 RepID=UPI002E2A7380|nr:DUF3455 domain-containing protein [Streptomyces sp. NBC_01429]